MWLLWKSVLAGIIIDCIFGVRCSAISTLSVQPGELENTTQVNVTGFLNHDYGVEVRIVMANVTWYTALTACADLKYGRLDNVIGYHSRTSMVASMFKEMGGFENISIWTNLLKPDPNKNDWVKFLNGQCQVTSEPQLDPLIDSEQCGYNVYDVTGSEPSLHTKNCSETLPAFQCVRFVDDLSNYTKYESFGVPNPLPPGIRSALDYYSPNFTDCLNTCDSMSFCVGFTHNTSDGECIRYMAEYGVAYVKYTVVRLGDDISHYAKTGIPAILVNDLTSAEIQNADTFECPPLSTSEPSTTSPFTSIVTSGITPSTVYSSTTPQTLEAGFSTSSVTMATSTSSVAHPTPIGSATTSTSTPSVSQMSPTSSSTISTSTTSTTPNTSQESPSSSFSSTSSLSIPTSTSTASVPQSTSTTSMTISTSTASTVTNTSPDRPSTFSSTTSSFSAPTSTSTSTLPVTLSTPSSSGIIRTTTSASTGPQPLQGNHSTTLFTTNLSTTVTHAIPRSSSSMSVTTTSSTSPVTHQLPVSTSSSTSASITLISTESPSASSVTTNASNLSVVQSTTTVRSSTSSEESTSTSTPYVTTQTSEATSSVTTALSSSSATSKTSSLSPTNSSVTSLSTEVSIPSTEASLCFCKDFCGTSQNDLNETDMEEVIVALVQNLTINPKETTKFKQSLISVEDDRASSKAIGAIAITFISIVFTSIVLSDISLLIKVQSNFGSS